LPYRLVCKLAIFFAFDHEMRAALTIQGTSIVLHDTKAQQLLSTNRPFRRTPASREQQPDARPRCRNPQATGFRPRNGFRVAAADCDRGVPVFRNGEVAYVLALGLGPEILSAVLQDQKLSPDWTAAILDRKGIIVGRNRDLDRFPRPAGRTDAP